MRFGVLNAGNFGVSQSRKRTFIWGVAPDNELPQWPAPLHVFHSPQLTIKLPGGVEVGTISTHTQPSGKIGERIMIIRAQRRTSLTMQFKDAPLEQDCLYKEVVHRER